MPTTITPVDTAVSVSPSALDVVLKAVKPAVDAKSSVAALGGVLLTANEAGLHVSATNLEVAVRRRVVDAVVERDLDVVASAAMLAQAVKALAKCESITIGHDRESGEVILHGGRRVIRLRTLRREDFPPMPRTIDPSRRVFEASAADFKSVISRILPFASGDETRPILTGVCFERRTKIHNHEPGPIDTVTATDSYRLAVLQSPFPLNLPNIQGGEHQPLIIPALALKLVLRNVKAGTVSMYAPTDTPFAGLVNHDACEEWAVRTIGGQFPNWSQLIPDTHEVIVDMPTEHLRSAATLASQFCQRNAPMRVAVNGNVQVTGHTPDVCSIEEIIDDAQIGYLPSKSGSWTPYQNGEPLEIGFNPEFMLDIAKTVRGDRCKLKLISPLRPGLVDDDGDLFLLMPIRLNV